MKTIRNLALTAVVALSLVACAKPDPNKIAMDVGTPPTDTFHLRALETRRFDTLDEKALLSAGTQTLQDLGFTISESASSVGTLVASKQRDATETGQVVGAIILGALFGAGAATWDRDQTITVTLVSTPVANSKQFDVRVSFDRLITNNKEQTRAELIQDPQIYQQFFDKLSAGATLEAHSI